MIVHNGLCYKRSAKPVGNIFDSNTVKGHPALLASPLLLAKKLFSAFAEYLFYLFPLQYLLLTEQRTLQWLLTQSLRSKTSFAAFSIHFSPRTEIRLDKNRSKFQHYQIIVNYFWLKHFNMVYITDTKFLSLDCSFSNVYIVHSFFTFSTLCYLL